MSGEQTGPAYRWIPSFVVVFLLFAPQLAALAIERNRYFLFWDRLDTLAACAAFVVLSLAGIALGGLVNRNGSAGLRDLRDQILVGLFGLGVLANLLPVLHFHFLLDLLRHHRALATLCLRVGLIVALVGWILLLLYRREMLPRVVRASCLILSPLIPIVIVPAIAWNDWYVDPDPLPRTASAPKAGTPVFIFVFDELSFLRSTEGDGFLSDLRNLNDLRGQSFFFRHARSPSRTTYLSMPELIFQSHEYPSLPHVYLNRSDFPDRFGSSAPEEAITPPAPPGRTPDSLFSLAKKLDYSTYMLGYYLPYRLILGDAVDMVRTYSDYPRGGNFLEKMTEATIQNPHFWRLPVVSGLWKRLYAPIFSRHWVHLNEQLVQDFDRVVMAAPERSFVFLHFPAPHAPFVYDADGRYRGPFAIHSSMTEDIDADIMGGTPDDYHLNLRHLDLVVGHLLAALRRAGRFDEALIILTSDHSWRYDPTFPSPIPADLVRHVPLLVKCPGQVGPQTIDEPIDGRSLGPLIDRALHGGLDPASAAALIATLTDSGPGEPGPGGPGTSGGPGPTRAATAGAAPPHSPRAD